MLIDGVITWHKHWERQNFTSAISHVKSNRDLLRAHSAGSPVLRQVSIRSAIGNAIDVTPSTSRTVDDAKVVRAFPTETLTTTKTVKVSCGGHVFEFGVATIRQVASPGSLLREMVDSAVTDMAIGCAQLPFLDRAHDQFSHVINWHRNGGRLPCLGALSRATLLNLQEEAKYFREPALLNAVNEKLALMEGT